VGREALVGKVPVLSRVGLTLRCGVGAGPPYHAGVAAGSVRDMPQRGRGLRYRRRKNAHVLREKCYLCVCRAQMHLCIMLHHEHLLPVVARAQLRLVPVALRGSG